MAKTPQEMTDEGLWRMYVSLQNQIRRGDDRGSVLQGSHAAGQEIDRRGLTKMRPKRQATARGTIVLDRETCDWVIDEEADSAICRTHGEICDGVDSKHFPGDTVVI